MKSNAEISFDGYQWFVDKLPVANPQHFIGILKKRNVNPLHPDTRVQICALRWVKDTDQIWVIDADQLTHIPFGSKCQCGVPSDVHGTCCGWRNAKITVDPRSLRIVDDRHPFYNKNLNDWINSPAYLV